MSTLTLTGQSKVYLDRGAGTEAISYAVKGLARDWQTVFGQVMQISEQSDSCAIEIINENKGLEDESFSVDVSEKSALLRISGANELGTIFGIYHFCEKILCVDPYGYWTDFLPDQKEEIVLNPTSYCSPKPAVRFRGWFVNGEDCLIGWEDDETISLEKWEIIFETFLRDRFNMIIPGTCVPFDADQVALAGKMGLWVTQHHTEPLGARLFAEVYPDIEPDPETQREKFIGLYREAIAGLAAQKVNVLFALGFRGQGDRPFWDDCPQYDTPAKRANVINEIIDLQRKLVKEISPELSAYCVVYIYGELAELMQAGLLKIDSEVMLVWSDNGYGAMAMRRLGCVDPGIDVFDLAKKWDVGHGIYYHVNFHHLQASNQLTMLVAPELVVDELGKFISQGLCNCLVLNVGNIWPHVFAIELVSKVCFQGLEGKKTDQFVNEHYRQFSERHFGGNAEAAAEIYHDYFDAPLLLGPRPDQRASDELYHYAIRSMLHKLIGNAQWRYFMYVPDPDMSYEDRVDWYRDKGLKVQHKWDQLADEFDAAVGAMSGREQQFFQDNIGLQIKFCQAGNRALTLTADAVPRYQKDNSDPENLLTCFLEMSKVVWILEETLQVLVDTEHEKWKNFYRGDWLTGVRMTLRFARTFRSLVCIRGESHPYETWYRDVTKAGRVAVMLKVSASKKFDDDDEYARFLMARFDHYKKPLSHD